MPGRRLRIGWFTAIGDEGATPEVAASIAAAVAGLAASNCEVAPVSAPFDLGALRTFHATLTAAAAARIVVRFPDRWRAETCDNVRAAAERGLAISAAVYVDALDALAAWRADVTAAWGDYDALILPTAAAPPGAPRMKHRPASRRRRKGCSVPGSTPPDYRASASRGNRIPMGGRSACRSSHRSAMMPSFLNSPSDWKRWRPGPTGGRRWRQPSESAALTRQLATRAIGPLEHGMLIGKGEGMDFPAPFDRFKGEVRPECDRSQWALAYYVMLFDQLST